MAAATSLDFSGLIRRLGRHNKCLHRSSGALGGVREERKQFTTFGGNTMKIWTKPAVREQEVGLEVTSYLPAEIDLI